MRRTPKFTAGVVAIAAATVSLVTLGLPSPGSAGADAVGPTYIGPLQSSAENATTDWGRDAGYSVPLPNGKDFWIFGDTPLYQLSNGAWYLTNFVDGSTAGVVKYALGKPPAGPFNEFALKTGASPTTPPQHFLPNPKLYLPDGSWRPCSKAIAGSSTESVRWPQGAVLMPDRVNVLISYLGVCTYQQTINVETFGFALYNWKTKRFSQPPFDVLPPKITGAGIPPGWNFGSPVIANNQVTFYSFGSSIYSTTVAANLKALKNPTSYQPTPIAGLPQSYPMYVAPPSYTQRHFTMYQLTGNQGQYQLLTSATPQGPWSVRSSGVLPGCDTSPRPCFTVALHPELSKTSQVLATYYLPGAGNGIGPTYPPAAAYYGHLVMAYLPD